MHSAHCLMHATCMLHFVLCTMQAAWLTGWARRQGASSREATHAAPLRRVVDYATKEDAAANAQKLKELLVCRLVLHCFPPPFPYIWHVGL